MTLGNYQKDYICEYILTKTTIKNGQKEQEREWVDNPIQNQHISGRAAVLGSDVDQDFFNFRFLQEHRGGLLASKTLQVYGTHVMWKKSFKNFMVCLDKDVLPDIIAENYDEETICYTGVKNCLRYPGHFYIVPHTPQLDERAMTLYCAAFDGHREIFMIGFHNNDSNITDESIPVKQVNAVIESYPGTEFYFVGHKGAIYNLWDNNYNFHHMTYREWVSHCDIG